MFPKPLSTTFVAAALAVKTARKAAADSGDCIAGAVVGGRAGQLITKDQKQRKQKQKKSITPYLSTIPSTTERRQI